MIQGSRLPPARPRFISGHANRALQMPPVLPAAFAKAALLAAAMVLPARGWASPAATNEILWQEPGIQYYCDSNPRIPLAVHVVRIDRSHADLEFHTTLGGGREIGLAALSDQVNYINPKFGKAVAAINGDYFYHDRPFQGDPMNLQILRGGELVSGPGDDRAFLYFDAKGEPHLTNAVAAFTVTWPDGKVAPIGLNEIPPKAGQAVLFTSVAGPNTRIEGVELILERNGDQPWLPLRIGQTISARVREVNRQGHSKLSSDCLVLSLDSKQLEGLPALEPGSVLKICTATKPDLSGATLAIGGGPTLVRDGKARQASEFNGIQMRDPRSALGWNAKYFFLVAADGRQPRHSMGMSLEELANYFVKLGCDYAMNLDGGGSCTTWAGGKTVNSPSQRGRERAAANALVVVRKPKAG
jgi:hypothetical protein